MYVLLIAAAAVWGAASGFLVPRAAYRLAVEPEDPWRTACPGGHPLTGPLGGWLGHARCASAGAPAPAPGPDVTASVAADAGGAEAQADATPEAGATADADALVEADPRAEGEGETAAGAGPDAADARVVAPAVSAAATPAVAAARCTGRGSYGPRTSVVVAVTALACAALAAATGPRPELVVWVLATPVAVLLALVDYQVHRLPDVLTLPLGAATALLLGAAALLPQDGGSWPVALLGALALGAAYFVLFLINPNGMGFGDVKLSLALGAALGWYGWSVLIAGAFLGLLLGAVYGLGLMALRRAGRKSAIPLGPFIIGGTFLGLLLGGLGAS